MVLSKVINSARLFHGIKRVSVSPIIRNSGHSVNYRSAAPAPNHLTLCAEVVQGVAWWWVLWHLWTEPDHILGEFEYPDPRNWTDEELGIPLD